MPEDLLDTARLRAARERLGLQQIELAAHLGIARSAIGEYERGAKTPRYDVLKRLCRKLGVSADWLLGLDPQAPAAPRQPSGDVPSSAEDILADFGAPPGLRDLADSKSHQAALRIAPEEWAALASLDYHDGLTREGYVALLVLLRSASLASQRRALDRLPGKHVTRAQPAADTDTDDSPGGNVARFPSAG